MCVKAMSQRLYLSFKKQPSDGVTRASIDSRRPLAPIGPGRARFAWYIVTGSNRGKSQVCRQCHSINHQAYNWHAPRPVISQMSRPRVQWRKRVDHSKYCDDGAWTHSPPCPDHCTWRDRPRNRWRRRVALFLGDILKYLNNILNIQVIPHAKQDSSSWRSFLVR